jgi:hypothetical protein
MPWQAISDALNHTFPGIHAWHNRIRGRPYGALLRPGIGAGQRVSRLTAISSCTLVTIALEGIVLCRQFIPYS